MYRYIYTLFCTQSNNLSARYYILCEETIRTLYTIQKMCVEAVLVWLYIAVLLEQVNNISVSSTSGYIHGCVSIL